MSFPSNLVGIVGPNGCGKSNVIDAVRWVMGESSAKMLRGESMADVIFNGSTGRKPVGVASIELIFDNSDGGAGGEYAAFNQISVKRQVARDGQSAYFLNGSRCRRRDIQDLFLGTGLGPRSYAIIEQGMISRIIEARPEDLRLFLEEAAGISKYKERRRETESRMRNTRENLDRLNDLREEVGKQLQHLERQASTAEKYTQLRAEERRLDLELKALRWRALDDELQSMERRLAEAENIGQEGIARQRRLEADIEARRAEHAAASDTLQRGPGALLRRGRGDRARRAGDPVRQRGARASRGRAGAARSGAVRGRASSGARPRAADRDRPRARPATRPGLEQAEAELAESVGALMTVEDQLKGWETEWDGFNQAAARPSEQAQLERARINGLEQGMARDRERLRRIEEEIARLEGADVRARLEELTEREGDLAERIDAQEDARQRAADDLAERDEALRALVETMNRLRTRLQEAKGRLASLTALQEAALADTDAERRAWLDSRGLAAAPRLVDHLEVEAGWERAVETLLGEALRGVGADGLDRFGAEGAELPPGLLLLDTSEPGAAARVEAAAGGAGGLGRFVRAPWPLDSLLGGVGVAQDLPDALGSRDALRPGRIADDPARHSGWAELAARARRRGWRGRAGARRRHQGAAGRHRCPARRGGGAAVRRGRAARRARPGGADAGRGGPATGGSGARAVGPAFRSQRSAHPCEHQAERLRALVRGARRSA